MLDIVRIRNAACLAAIAAVGCGGAGSQSGSAIPAIQIDTTFPGANQFVTSVTNPYFPLTPKTVYHFNSPAVNETNRVEVTTDTKTIIGVQCVVVHDQVFTGGTLSEDTLDWYAQDKAGNVWYFGEDSHEIQNGVPTSGGSWQSGVNGAVPGIVMLAHPVVGDKYRQEYQAGVAEDQAQVLSLNKTVTVPAGTYNNCVQTMDYTHLEPGSREMKSYAPGVGVVKEQDLGHGRANNELVSIEHLP